MATLRDAVQCLMLTVAILAAFSCISRPDYNFPLYLYLWWVFFYVPEHKKRQRRVMLLYMMLSCIQDVIFLFYWPTRWFSHEWLSLSAAEEGVQALATIFGIAELLIKVLILVVLLVPSAFDPARVVRHLNSQSDFVRFDLPTTSLDQQQMQQYSQVQSGPPMQTSVVSAPYL